MKKIISVLFSVMFSVAMLCAQQNMSTLPLTVVVEDFPHPFPASAKVQMSSKINQMLSANGVASTNMYSDFCITVIANAISKDVVSGAPAQIVQTLDFTFYIVDVNRQLIFSTYTTTSKGVGESESKSYIDAMKRVNIKSPDVERFLNEGRDKIVAYYDSQAENIFTKSRMLARQRRYEEAFFNLCTFPAECANYKASIAVGNEIYQAYVDYNAQENLHKAKAEWAATQNSYGAAKAGEYLSQILPDASCYFEALDLYNEIKAKISADWKWEMKKYEDGVDLEYARLSAWKAVGIEYGRNQKPVTTNLAWLR